MRATNLLVLPLAFAALLALAPPAASHVRILTAGATAAAVANANGGASDRQEWDARSTTTPIAPPGGLLQALSTNSNSTNTAIAYNPCGFDPTYGLEWSMGGGMQVNGDASARIFLCGDAFVRVTGGPAPFTLQYAAYASPGLTGPDVAFDVYGGPELGWLVRRSGLASPAESSGTLPPGFYLVSANFNYGAFGPAAAVTASGQVALYFGGYDQQPHFTSDPDSRLFTGGDSLVQNLTANDPLGTNTYQWQWNGTPLADGGGVSGAGSATLVIKPFDASRNGAYRCILVSSAGNDTSATAVWEYDHVSSPPRVVNPPMDQPLNPDGNVFMVDAASSGPLTYQWRHAGQPLVDGAQASGATVQGAHAALLFIGGASGADAGDYACTVTNAFGSVESGTAHLTNGTTAVEPEPAGALRFAAAPNPARTATALDFALPADGVTHLAIYDVTGRAVATLADGALGAGEHRVAWDLRGAGGARVAPGVYLARLEAGGARQVRRLVVLE